MPRHDGWLLPFLEKLKRAGDDVLEAGCGPGFDARMLLEHGFRVTALDRGPLERAKEQAGAARLLRADLSRPLPFRRASFDAAVASLSLHYMPWAETVAAFEEVRRVLRPGGVFAFRVNATDDFAHGAGQGTEIEPNYYAHDGPYSTGKRFFDEAAVRELLAKAGFEVDHLAHRTIVRYVEPKQVWECVAVRKYGAPGSHAR